jgi:hypothetical protein
MAPGLEVVAELAQERRLAVAEVVEAHVGEAGEGQQRGPDPGEEVLLVDRSADRRREDVVGVLPAPLWAGALVLRLDGAADVENPLDHVDHRLVAWVVGLVRGAVLEAAALGSASSHPGEGGVHDELSVPDLAPEQTEDLALAHPGQDADDDHAPEGVGPGGPEQAPCVTGCEDRGLVLRHGDRRRVLRVVLENDVATGGPLADLTEEAPGVIPRRLGDGADLGAEELVEEAHVEPGEPHRPEGGEDVDTAVAVGGV